MTSPSAASQAGAGDCGRWQGDRRPEQERERVVSLHVVHLADEEQAGAEADRAEHQQRLADVGVTGAPVPEEIAGAVGPRDRCEQDSDPRRARDRVPVGGEEQDHAEPAGDGADQGERTDHELPASLPRSALLPRPDRLRLLPRDQPFGDPGIDRVAQLSISHTCDNSDSAISVNPGHGRRRRPPRHGAREAQARRARASRAGVVLRLPARCSGSRGTRCRGRTSP